jgi:neutral ceramidase
MFMAGAVGSHAPIPNIPESEERIQRMGSILTNASQQAQWYPITDHTLLFVRIPLLTGKQQIKVLPDWRVREWLSLRLMGSYTPSLTMLQVGNIVMLGTPCDFSGMLTNPLYETARQHQRHAFVTSFNGGYIGYVTPDRYYDLQHYETQTMNWYGPGNGGYLQQCLLRMLEKSSEE